jgi:hypothetical protein
MQPAMLPAVPAVLQELLKAVVALKQLHKENKKLTSNFDNVSQQKFWCISSSCGPCMPSAGCSC